MSWSRLRKRLEKLEARSSQNEQRVVQVVRGILQDEHGEWHCYVHRAGLIMPGESPEPVEHSGPYEHLKDIPVHLPPKTDALAPNEETTST